MNGLSLCAGIGGLDLGLRMAMPGRYRCVGYCEREAAAAAVLVARMEEQALGPAPVWDDLGTFPSHLYRGKVDLISAGFPCQPWSVAGKRAGVGDERWIWPRIARIVRVVGPRYVFLENVRGLVSGGGLGPVLGELASLGFDAEWEVFSAAEVGAPHRRERVFILAHRDGARCCELRGDGLLHGERTALGDHADGCGATVGDAFGAGLAERGHHPARESFPAAWPPGPEDIAAWDEWSRQDGPQPAVRGSTDGAGSRVERLRMLGNGVVPQQAALAWRVLSGRI